jgi:hypothetical protein
MVWRYLLAQGVRRLGRLVSGIFQQLESELGGCFGRCRWSPSVMTLWQSTMCLVAFLVAVESILTSPQMQPLIPDTT